MAAVDRDAPVPRQRDANVPRKRQTRRLTETGVFAALFFAFAEVAIQLVTLAISHQPNVTLALSEPVATSFSRPDIVDRNGRLLATDLQAPSIFADPGVVLDRDEVVEKLTTVLPDLDAADLRARARRPVAPLRVGAPRRVAESCAIGS